jgi:DNA-directed RNA polymerase specialized sigma24 family protein
MRFIQALPNFTYDRSRGGLRSWLKTVTRNLLADLSAKCRKSKTASQHDSLLLVLQSKEARVDLEDRVVQQYELEMLEEAMSLVKNQVEPHTWDAYVRTAVRGEKAPTVAAALGLPVANVYKAKSNVMKMVKKMCRHLEERENQS